MLNSEKSSTISVLSELFYERETEYFGMTPYALLDRIGSIIVDKYFSTLSNLHSNTLPASCPFLSETQIAAALTQWTLCVEASIDKNFELFETYFMKNILALPHDFPIDKFLEEDEGESRVPATTCDLIEIEDKMQQVMRKLKSATEKNRKLKIELELVRKQERGLVHFETHLNCIKNLLSQYKIDSFEVSMSTFVSELLSLKSIVQETLIAGSNYLFAKYDSELSSSSNNVSADNSDNNNQESTSSAGSTISNAVSKDAAYRRILAEMAGLSAAQTSEQIEGKRREISMELSEKTKISTIPDFQSLRTAIQKLSSC